MTMKTLIATGAASIVLFTACASSAGTTRPIRQRTLEVPSGAKMSMEYRADSRGVIQQVKAPLEDVRTVVVSAYEEMGFGVDESSDQLVVTPFFRIRGRLYTGEQNSIYLDCGKTAAGRHAADIHEDIRFRMLTMLAPTDEGTRIETRLDGEAQPQRTSTGPVPCSGTGVLERRINLRVLAETVIEEAGL